jgi:DNA replication protein DnaC
MIHASELAELAYRDAAAEVAALRATSVLVVDDVGVERLDRDGIYTRFFGALMNARYGAAGFTVLTTNLTTDETRERYGERVYDRIRERAVWFDIAHGSLRGQR